MAKVASLLHLVSRKDETAAAEALGDAHPVVQLCGLRRSLFAQLAVTSAAAVAGVVGIVGHVSSAPIVVGAAVAVGFVLVLILSEVTPRLRGRVHELIIAAGTGTAHVPLVARERRRLGSPRRRKKLARALERALHDALNWNRMHPRSRPLPGLLALRGVETETRRAVALLRADSVHVEGVARTERLLSANGSHLFTGDEQLLRNELRSIAELLEADERLAA